MAARVYVAKETIHVQTKTGVVTIYKGERIREGHAYLAGREVFFTPLDDDVMYDVEQATKAPGEKRGTITLSAPDVPSEKRGGAKP